MKAKIVSCFVSVLFCLVAMGQEEASDWVLEKEEEGIEISYRWIQDPGKPRVREMKAVFTVHAAVPNIVEHFTNASKLDKWQTSVQKCKVKNLAANQWETYLQFDLPWPLKSKDLVTHNVFSSTEGFSLIESTSTPHVISEVKNTNRIQSLESVWKMTPLKNGTTKVVYTSVSYDKPEFPRAIADPIIQGRLIKTLNLLKKNSEDE